MMRIDEVFHHYQRPFAQGSEFRIQYLGDRTGDAVLSEAILKLDATVSISTGEE